jgi:transposase InsO family protein
MYLRNISNADLVQLEGRHVLRVDPVTEAGTDTVTHYRLMVQDPEEGAVQRVFRNDEIPHLIEQELLVIDRGFHCLARQTDRQLHGTREVHGATPKQRASIDRKVFLARRMAHYHALGMLRTREGVEAYRNKLSKDDLQYQARTRYGTDRPNTSQYLKPLPAASTLLRYDKLLRMAGGDPRVFQPSPSRSDLLDPQQADDHLFILNQLYRYERDPSTTKEGVAEATVEAIRKENAARRAAGIPNLIPERSTRTYERYIDKYLDPYSVTLHREGDAAARRKFGTTETGVKAEFPGQKVQMDFWNMHILTLPVTRAEWRRMTADERRKLKPVRRWIVVVIDVATRVILGYAICRTPNQAASLQALRMCFMDKTFLLRAAGITKAHWNFVCPLIEVTTDSGSEFGKYPFGGSRFSSAVRRLTGSLMTTVTGLPHLRGHVERWNSTADRGFARPHAGYTGSNPTKLGGRKPHEEACMTDDELDLQFARFAAYYHAQPNRNLGRVSPADKWEELSADPRLDPSQIPDPAALRESCGTFVDVDVAEEGILFEGIRYANAFTRAERMKPGHARIAKPGERVEASVDPMDLGSISLRTRDVFVAVPAVDPEMRGIRLVDWRAARRRQRAEASEKRAARAEERAEARDALRETAALIARSAGVGPRQYTLEEVDRMAREVRDFGKGQHEKRIVGREEYRDPLMYGFAMGADEEDDADPGAADLQDPGIDAGWPEEGAAAGGPGVVGAETDDAATAEDGAEAPCAPPSAPGGLDRFRRKVKPRSGGSAWQEDH